MAMLFELLPYLVLFCVIYYMRQLSTTAGAESSGPDGFSEDQWNAFVRRTGILRSWRAGNQHAPKKPFLVRAAQLHNVCQPVNRLVEGDMSRTESRSGNVSQSMASDKGGHISGGGGVPGGQGSMDVAVAKQKALGTSSARNDTNENARRRSQYIATELFLIEDWLELSEDCKQFFECLPETTAASSLDKFEATFGSCFYSRVELGVSRESVSAASQDVLSRTSDNEQARTLQVEASGAAPNVKVGGGLYRNVEHLITEASAASHGSKDSDQYSHGGAANRAHVDDVAWRASLLDPNSWVVLPDGRHDPISCLELVHHIAQREALKDGDAVAKSICQRVSGLITFQERIKKRSLERLEELRQDAIQRTRQILHVDFKIEDKSARRSVVVWTSEHKIIETIQVRLLTREGDTKAFVCKRTPSELRGQCSIPGWPSLSSGPLEVSAVITLSSGWIAWWVLTEASNIIEYEKRPPRDPSRRDLPLTLEKCYILADRSLATGRSELAQGSRIDNSQKACSVSVILHPKYDAAREAVAQLTVLNENAPGLSTDNEESPVLVSDSAKAAP